MSDKDRIENAIRHIQTATDIDPWAMEIAVDAMQRMLDVDGDLISRQDAIDAFLAVTGNSSVRELYEHVQEHGLSDMWSGGVNAAIDIIIALPSAQPERDTPKRVLWTGWKGRRYTRYNCPNCKKPVRNDDVYCHRCGQKLMFPKVSHTPYVEGQKQEVIVRWDDE